MKKQVATTILLFAILLVGTATLNGAPFIYGHGPSGVSSQPASQLSYYPATRSYMGLPYDEQSGITFTQDFSSLTFNVTAVAQTGPDGNGPGYLLSGLTDAGYWYQAGLSYKWPDTNGGYLPGFAMNYEVFNANPYSFGYGSSIYPLGGGGGIMNLTISPGDTVLLSLDIANNGNVTMSAYDWNDVSSAVQSFYGYSANFFVGTPGVSQSGFFTGLMTEQYYSTPYLGAGQPVIYSDFDFNYSTATLWVDQWNTLTGVDVFRSQTNSPVTLNSSSNNWPGYLSSNGTAEAANVHEFATDLQPFHIVSVHVGSPSIIHPGDSPGLNLTFQNSDQLAGRVTSVRLVTDFGTYNITDLLDLAPGTTSHSFTIAIPTSLTAGNYTVILEGTWQEYDPQLGAWISPGSTETSARLSVMNVEPSAGLLGVVRSLLPEILAVAGAVAVAAVLLFTTYRRRRSEESAKQVNVSQLGAGCPSCGQAVSVGMMFCPHCGASLTPPASQATLCSKSDPPGQPPG